MQMTGTPEQTVLKREQLDAFDFDGFVESQNLALRTLLSAHQVALAPQNYIVDIGGGCGYFARQISDLHPRIKVYETDLKSIETCRANGIEAHLNDATHPRIEGNERLICLNLILHHLIGNGEAATRQLQQAAIKHWKNQYLFVHEYCYESFFGGELSGRLIYLITSSRLLSLVGKLVSKFIPSLRANTFGVGVRFRSSPEWIKFFKQSGFKTLGVVHGESEDISLARRLLLIKSIRRDSFLIKFGN